MLAATTTPAEAARPRTLLLASRIAFAVAAVAALVVAPQLWTTPTVRKPAETIAFLVNAAFNIGIGAVLLFPVVRRGNVRRKVILWALATVAALLGLALAVVAALSGLAVAVVAALFGVALIDAAEAFMSHPGILLVTVCLFLSVVGELVTAALCVTAAVQGTRSVAT